MMHPTRPLMAATLLLAANALGQTPGLALQPTASRPSTRPAETMLFPIRQDDASGYIDATGRMVIPPQFERTDEFRSGRAHVVLKGVDGYIDNAGTVHGRAWLLRVPSIHGWPGTRRQA